jgi:hypothetical protein
MHNLPRIPAMGAVPLNVPANGLGQMQQHQQQAQLVIQQAIQEMAAGIYSGLAADHIAELDTHEEIGRDRLKQVAADSLVAARCYFEGLGAISPEA